MRSEERVTNEEITKRAGFESVTKETKRRSWTCLGHMLRVKKKASLYRLDLDTSQGKRKRRKVIWDMERQTTGRPRGGRKVHGFEVPRLPEDTNWLENLC